MRPTGYVADGQWTADYLAGAAQVCPCTGGVSRDAARRRRGNQTRGVSATVDDAIDRRIQFSAAVVGVGAISIVETGVQRDAGGAEEALQRSRISREVSRRGDQAAGTVLQHLEPGDGQFCE